MPLLKNTASQNITFALISATTGLGVPAATLATLKSGSFVTKDNGSQAATGGTYTEAGNGQYNYSPTQAETNATDVGFIFIYTGCIPVNADFHTDLALSVQVPTAITGDPYAQLNTLIGHAFIYDSNNLPEVAVKEFIDQAGIPSNLPFAVRAGVTQAGSTSTTIVLASSASGGTGNYVGQLVQIDNAVRTIVAYNGSTKTATVDRAWAFTPGTGVNYTIWAFSCPPVDASGNVTANAAGDFTASMKTSLNAATPASVQFPGFESAMSDYNNDDGFMATDANHNQLATSAQATEIAVDTDTLITTIGVAGVGLTNLGDSRITNLDATISSRSAPATPQTLDQTTAVAGAGTIAQCLQGAWVQAYGKWVLSGTTLTLYLADGVTVAKTFTLDSNIAPTQRA